MTTKGLLIFLWGLFFGYIWANIYVAKWLYKLGYRSLYEVPQKQNDGDIINS